MLDLAGSWKALPRILLLAAAFALSAVGQAARGDDLQEASKLLRAGQHAQALERVNRVLAAKPRDAQGRFLKGLIFTDQGNVKEAVVIFQKLTEDYPELPEPYNNLAVIYAAQGQYDKARSALEQSIRTHPSYATAYENLGDVYARLASQAYDKALQLDSTNSAAQNKLSLVRELVGGASRPAAAAKAVKPAVVAAATPAESKGVAEGKPADAKAVDKPATIPAAKSAAGGSDEIVQMLNAWARAWSKKDVDSYLAFYARDFKTPKGEARSDWEKGRRQRIVAPKSISVGVESAKVNFVDDGRASVTFRQHYRSDTLSANSRKTLVLVRKDGRWLIQQEQVAN